MNNYPNPQAQRHANPEFLKSEVFTAEPDGVAQAQRWMTKLGQELSEVDRQLTEMRNPAFRVMMPGGRFASPADMATIRNTLIETKNAIVARKQDLRDWRNAKVRAVKRGEDTDADVYDSRLSVNVRNMRAVVKRYQLLDAVCEAVRQYLDTDEDAAFDALNAAVQAIDDFDREHGG